MGQCTSTYLISAISDRSACYSIQVLVFCKYKSRTNILVLNLQLSENFHSDLCYFVKDGVISRIFPFLAK